MVEVGVGPQRTVEVLKPGGGRLSQQGQGRPPLLWEQVRDLVSAALGPALYELLRVPERRGGYRPAPGSKGPQQCRPLRAGGTGRGVGAE